MKSLIVLVVALLCVNVSPTTAMGGWPKPSEVSNEEKLMNAGRPQPHLFAGKFNFGDSKVWKCTYNNGSGVAVSITYPSPPHPPSRKPPTPSSPKMAPPPPKPSPPKKSPPPPNPSLPPPKQSPPPPKPSPLPPTPKRSPPPPKPSPPPTPKMSPPSPPRPALNKSPPPPNPSFLTPNESPPLPKTSTLIIPSPPPPHESIPAQSPPKEPTTPTTPWPYYQNPLGHFINCMTEFGPSAVCKQQIELSYYTGRFRVSDQCCNIFVNMRNECSDVILGFYDDRNFLPLLRCTCHVKIY
ncbi:hypothetical protein N665_0349s0020 [Sinapis alba]|nr:hypothetical protein N665_0349s0020 [Sinapis alba]